MSPMNLVGENYVRTATPGPAVHVSVTIQVSWEKSKISSGV